jgi:hypothetical protein
MHARFPLILLACSFAVPALADKKLDPDPAFLAKARTAATATVEPHYDLVSDKVPFWARFLICAGQLTAARDEGRALPAPKDTLDKLIAEYRALAAELLAYRRPTDAKAPATDADAEIVKIRGGAMEFLPGDVTKLGVETMKKRAGERVAFCQLTRDWYEVQNGIRTATPAADQQKLTAVHDEAMRKIAAQAPKPPKVPQFGSMPPALKPSTVQPVARTAPAPSGPAAQPIPTAKVIVPAAGAPAGGANPKDATVGPDIAHTDARAEFAGRPVWSALAECSGRMDLIQQRTGDSTRLQSDSYARRAAYVLWGNRAGDAGGGGLAAMAAPVQQERARLAVRVAASWDEYRQRTGQLPLAYWGQVCWGLDQYALAQATRIHTAKKQQADREYAEAMKRFNETSSSSSSSSSGGGYSSSGGNSSLDAAAAASRAEHQRNMEQYKRDTQQIRNEIKAIDRKYR